MSGAATGIAVSLLAATCGVSASAPAARAAALGAAAPGGGAIGVTQTCEHLKVPGPAGLAPWQYGGRYGCGDRWGDGGRGGGWAPGGCWCHHWPGGAAVNGDDHRDIIETSPGRDRAFRGVPVRGLHRATAAYSQAGQGGGVYADAFDIWLDGIAVPWATEIMIWTDEHGQVPRGWAVARATISGRQYVVWKTAGVGGTISFVATRNSATGVLNLLSFFDWLAARHWMSPCAVLRQVTYGADIVPGGSAPGGSAVTNFWVRTA